MKKLLNDAAKAIGACAGFTGSWVVMTLWVEVTGIAFGIPGIIIVSALGVYLGAKLGHGTLNRYQN